MRKTESGTSTTWFHFTTLIRRLNFKACPNGCDFTNLCSCQLRKLRMAQLCNCQLHKLRMCEVKYAIDRTMSPMMIAEYKRLLVPETVMKKSLEEYCAFMKQSALQKKTYSSSFSDLGMATYIWLPLTKYRTVPSDDHLYLPFEEFLKRQLPLFHYRSRQ